MLLALLLSLLAGVDPGRPVNARDKAASYFQEGMKAWRLERYSVALERFEMAVLVGRFAFAPAELGEASRMAAESALAVGQANPALQHAKEYLDWARSKGKPFDRARARNLLAAAYLVLGTPDDARAALDDARGDLALAHDPEQQERWEALVGRLAAAPETSAPASATATQPASPAPTFPLPPFLLHLPTPPAPSPVAMAEPAAPAEMAVIPEAALAPLRGPAFLLDRTEVTNEEFARFVAATGQASAGSWRSHAGPGLEREPARGVSLAEAQAFARWASKRLPSADEWERAARGGDGRHYAFGEHYDRRAARIGLDPGARGGPVAVGSYPANPFGVFDLTGNVAEWCLTDGGGASLCGGAWDANARTARVDLRISPSATAAIPASAGFRCARDLGPR